MDQERALAAAAHEHGLEASARDMVRPLLALPKRRWPSCCGGGCVPCAQTLASVAERALQLMAGEQR